MSLLEKASLIITPNAEKAGKLYSVIPSDGNADLTVVRGTVATRVNSLGVIENVAVNEPRLNYDTLGGCPAILIEPQRTNLLQRSEEFNNVIWSKLMGSTITLDNSISNPAGGTSNFIYTASNLAFGGILRQLITAVSGQSYTVSFFVKKINYRYVGIRFNTSQTSNRCPNYDFDTDTLNKQGVTCDLTRVLFPNGWVRLSLTFVTTSTVGTTDIALTTANGDTASALTGTEKMFVWGAQNELGAYPTSYIPTLGSAITRNLDNISKTAVSALIGQTEGTIFAEVRISKLIGTVSRYIFHISDGTANNRIYIAFSGASSNIIRARIFNAGNLETTIETSTITTTGRYKLALAYKNNDVVFYVNGVQIGTDVTASIPACSRVDLGQNYIAASQFADSIINPNIFKTRLTNTELQNLTTL